MGGGVFVARKTSEMGLQVSIHAPPLKKIPPPLKKGPRSSTDLNPIVYSKIEVYKKEDSKNFIQAAGGFMRSSYNESCFFLVEIYWVVADQPIGIISWSY